MQTKDKVAITLDKDLIKLLKAYSKKERRNFSEAINFIIANFFQKDKK